MSALKVLIIEGENTKAVYLKETLEKTGYIRNTVTKYEEALFFADRNKPDLNDSNPYIFSINLGRFSSYLKTNTVMYNHLLIHLSISPPVSSKGYIIIKNNK